MNEEKVYSEYIKVGVHIRKIRGKDRRFVSLRHQTGTHYKQMPYARYLMEVHLNRYLETNEEVDHIDEDCMNDNPDLSNYQILIKPVHTAKTNRNRKRI